MSAKWALSTTPGTAPIFLPQHALRYNSEVYFMLWLKSTMKPVWAPHECLFLMRRELGSPWLQSGIEGWLWVQQGDLKPLADLNGPHLIMCVNAKHLLNHIFHHRRRSRAHVNQGGCKGQYLSCRAQHKAQSERNISPSKSAAVVQMNTVVRYGFGT